MTIISKNKEKIPCSRLVIHFLHFQARVTFDWLLSIFTGTNLFDNRLDTECEATSVQGLHELTRQKNF